jgi:KDO2-lipid IV(A) lauroyltransferase
MVRAGVVDPRGTARAMYRELARGLVELLSLGLPGGPGRLAGVRLPLDLVFDLRRRQRGAVIATAHTGNWDAVACALARTVPLTVVTKRLSVRLFDRWWQGLRARFGVRLVGAGKAARVASTALRQGELVAMIVDQAPERRRAVVQAWFLGAPAWIDLAPALAAMRARAPLVAAFPFRAPDGTLAVEVARTFEPPDRPSRAWAERTMVQVTRALEDFVLRHPEQWLWMHRRWKPLPAPVDAGPRALPRASRSGIRAQ